MLMKRGSLFIVARAYAASTFRSMSLTWWWIFSMKERSATPLKFACLRAKCTGKRIGTRSVVWFVAGKRVHMVALACVCAGPRHRVRGVSRGNRHGFGDKIMCAYADTRYAPTTVSVARASGVLTGSLDGAVLADYVDEGGRGLFDNGEAIDPFTVHRGAAWERVLDRVIEHELDEAKRSLKRAGVLGRESADDVRNVRLTSLRVRHRSTASVYLPCYILDYAYTPILQFNDDDGASSYRQAVGGAIPVHVGDLRYSRTRVAGAVAALGAGLGILAPALAAGMLMVPAWPLYAIAGAAIGGVLGAVGADVAPLASRQEREREHQLMLQHVTTAQNAFGDHAWDRDGVGMPRSAHSSEGVGDHERFDAMDDEARLEEMEWNALPWYKRLLFASPRQTTIDEEFSVRDYHITLRRRARRLETMRSNRNARHQRQAAEQQQQQQQQRKQQQQQQQQQEQQTQRGRSFDATERQRQAKKPTQTTSSEERQRPQEHEHRREQRPRTQGRAARDTVDAAHVRTRTQQRRKDEDQQAQRATARQQREARQRSFVYHGFSARLHLRALGLEEGATLGEVKDVFRSLIFRHHPDHCPPEKKKEAVERTQQILRAYRALCRMEHDARTGTGA